MLPVQVPLVMGVPAAWAVGAAIIVTIGRATAVTMPARSKLRRDTGANPVGLAAADCKRFDFSN